MQEVIGFPDQDKTESPIFHTPRPGARETCLKAESIVQCRSWDPRPVAGPVMLMANSEPSSAVRSTSHTRSSAPSARAGRYLLFGGDRSLFYNLHTQPTSSNPHLHAQAAQVYRKTSKSFPLVAMNQRPCSLLVLIWVSHRAHFWVEA